MYMYVTGANDCTIVLNHKNIDLRATTLLL